MSNKHMYIDFHVLQTVPPSCVNRDDMGSPKTAVYGGAIRARISSQAQKHAMRLMFSEIFDAGQCGLRTKRSVKLVADKLIAAKGLSEEKATSLAMDLFTNAVTKEGKKMKMKNADVGTDALFFISDAQAEALSKADPKDKAGCKEALKGTPSIDMALFGRMVASDPSLNYDACAQVAHAISTHAVENEYDYFTAVDDLSPDDNAGAGHIGTVEFNSSTLYRYATVDVTSLRGLIGGDTAEAVRGFCEAFVRAMPTGKQNTFANRTLPDLIYVTVRGDQPVNLAGAFESPVKAREGYAAESGKRMAEYAARLYANYSGDPEAAFVVGETGFGDAKKVNFRQLLDEVAALAAEGLDK